jgi:hypothetical protein
LLAREAPIDYRIDEIVKLHLAKKSAGDNFLTIKAEIKKQAKENAETMLRNTCCNGLIGNIWFDDNQIRLNHWTEQAAQFLTGHGTFRAYLFRFNLSDDYKCRFCMDQPPETADHIMFYCTGFEDTRQRWLEHNMILNESSSQTKIIISESDFISFCKHTGIFK